MKNKRSLLLMGFIVVALSACLYLNWLAGQYAAPVNPTPFSKIEDGLYMGGYVDQPPPGTKAVLNLCQHRDSYQCKIHVWEPIPDAAPAPTLDWLRTQVEWVKTQRQAGRTTYIHCRAGISRSGMVTVAYLMEKNNWSRDKALAFVRTKREMARPNPAFMELLLKWERTLKTKETEG